MENHALLLIAIFLPLVGAAVVQLAALFGRESVCRVALATTLLTLVPVGMLAARFPANGDLAEQALGGFAGFQTDWVGALIGIDVQLRLGLDGLSLWLFVLSAILMVTAVLVSWRAIRDREPLFFTMLLLLETGCLGVFAARDVLLFYVFFEFTLIPLFFLIGIWGHEQRQFAAQKFFLYTLAGSLFTFLGLLSIVFSVYAQGGPFTFSIPELTAWVAAQGAGAIPVGLQLVIFVALFAGFAIKVPLFPFHTWLPLAHVQAPTAGSVFLAGILLKLGTYGFLRFSVPLLPEATAACMVPLLWLSVAGILYGALVALAQSDLKRLIAYSSVSHLGFCMLGLFALTKLGTHGSVLQMVNHGISTGALFAIVGMIYERYHTRQISELGGLARSAPWMGFFMLLFTFSSIGLPGLNGFAGEILILIGTFQRAWLDTAADAWQLRTISVLALLGVVLGAWYMLWLVQRVFFGKPHTPAQHGEDHPPADLTAREIAALAPLAVLVLWIGLHPQFFLDRMGPTLDNLSRPAEEAVAERELAETPPAAEVTYKEQATDRGH